MFPDSSKKQELHDDMQCMTVQNASQQGLKQHISTSASDRRLVSLLLEIGFYKRSLLLSVRVSTVVPLKASILIPVVPKIKTSVVVAAILKVNELHGGGINLTLLQGSQLLSSLCKMLTESMRIVDLRDCLCLVCSSHVGGRNKQTRRHLNARW